jgi:hypothetical protein
MSFEEWYKEWQWYFRNQEQAKQAWQAAQPQWQLIETIVNYDNVLLTDGEKTDNGFLGDCGFFKSFPICPSVPLGFKPTHWMPLPQPLE